MPGSDNATGVPSFHRFSRLSKLAGLRHKHMQHNAAVIQQHPLRGFVIALRVVHRGTRVVVFQAPLHVVRQGLDLRGRARRANDESTRSARSGAPPAAPRYPALFSRPEALRRSPLPSLVAVNLQTPSLSSIASGPITASPLPERVVPPPRLSPPPEAPPGSVVPPPLSPPLGLVVVLRRRYRRPDPWSLRRFRHRRRLWSRVRRRCRRPPAVAAAAGTRHRSAQSSRRRYPCHPRSCRRRRRCCLRRRCRHRPQSSSAADCIRRRSNRHRRLAHRSAGGVAPDVIILRTRSVIRRRSELDELPPSGPLTMSSAVISSSYGLKYWLTRSSVS